MFFFSLLSPFELRTRLLFWRGKNWGKKQNYLFKMLRKKCVYVRCVSYLSSTSFSVPKDEKLKKKCLINIRRGNRQKQPLEMFFEKRWSEKFCKIHRKKPVLEPLFNKAAFFGTCTSCTHYQNLELNRLRFC